jgi:signal transduction histidine kinase
MAFRIQARTILQLGAELISSDAIAFYELIKNAFDAGTKTVRIKIDSLLPHDVCNAYLDQIDETLVAKYSSERAKQAAFDSLLRAIKATINDHFFIEEKASRVALRQLGECDDLESFGLRLKDCNRVTISDEGTGMSLADLDEIFLTIGTRSRYKERKEALASGSPRVILGEKGIGRLSVMRLGREVSIETAKANDRFWNSLTIDWNIFSHESDQMLEEIDVEPARGERKADSEQSGTTIVIYRLTSTWTRGRVDDLMAEQFSRFVDPFIEDGPYKINVRFNDIAIPKIRFDQALLEAAHAELNATFEPKGENGPRLYGKVNYRRYNRVKTFSLEGAHLLKGTKMSTLRQLQNVGPFTADLYWFNRKYIEDTAGLEAGYIKKLVRSWAGGGMVYRDGFRVNPYGGPDDDWLGLDRKALASGGYKMNRNQLVGKISISALRNPALLDQTNREGIRDSDEKTALIGLLRVAILNEFKKFLDQVEEEQSAAEPVSFEVIERKVASTKLNLKKTWRTLKSQHPEVEDSPQLVFDMDEALEDLSDLLDDARTLVASYEKGKDQMVQLAGIGLMVEVVGHELNRATEHALRSLSDSRKAGSTADFESSLDSLHAQLKTLQKRLRILDPLSISGRQVKESFDLVAWVREIVEGHEAQFDRHDIEYSVDVTGKGRQAIMKVKAVKGMIVQIVENLLANSVYWLKAERVVNPGFQPKIVVLLDADRNVVEVTDNGPGIEAARAEEVFRPFVTSKPPSEGKGLGLYIAQELAKYHGCSLSLSPKKGPNKTLNTFVLDVTQIRQ